MTYRLLLLGLGIVLTFKSITHTMKQHPIVVSLLFGIIGSLFIGCAKKPEKRLVPPVRVYSHTETQKDITVKVVSELCDKQIYKKNPILKKYQPIEIIINNNSNEQIELAAYNIGIHFHSLHHILKKTPALGTGRKLLLIADAAGIAASLTHALLTELTLAGLLGVTAATTSWGTLLCVTPLLAAPFLIAPFLLLNTIVHVGKVNYQKSKIKKHLKRTILEPSHTIILDPHTTIRKSIFCPHKFMKQFFNITLVNTQTFEPYIFNISLKEQV